LIAKIRNIKAALDKNVLPMFCGFSKLCFWIFSRDSQDSFLLFLESLIDDLSRVCSDRVSTASDRWRSNAVKLKPFHFEVIRKIFYEMDARFLQEFCKKACAILEKPFFRLIIRPR
jgi:hypothetical protein